MIRMFLIAGIKVLSIFICIGVLYLLDNKDDIRQLYNDIGGLYNETL